MTFKAALVVGFGFALLAASQGFLLVSVARDHVLLDLLIDAFFQHAGDAFDV